MSRRWPCCVGRSGRVQPGCRDEASPCLPADRDGLVGVRRVPVPARGDLLAGAVVTPQLIDAARPCRHAVGSRCFVDETCVKVTGTWRYVHRAVDQHGQVIDVYLSAKRDISAARRFFTNALISHGEPVEVHGSGVGFHRGDYRLFRFGSTDEDGVGAISAIDGD